MDNTLFDGICDQLKANGDMAPQLAQLFARVSESFAADGLLLEGGWTIDSKSFETLVLITPFFDPSSGHKLDLVFSIECDTFCGPTQAWNSTWHVITAARDALVVHYIWRRPGETVGETEAFVAALGQLVSEKLAA